MSYLTITPGYVWLIDDLQSCGTRGSLKKKKHFSFQKWVGNTAYCISCFGHEQSVAAHFWLWDTQKRYWFHCAEPRVFQTLADNPLLHATPVSSSPKTLLGNASLEVFTRLSKIFLGPWGPLTVGCRNSLLLRMYNYLKSDLPSLRRLVTSDSLLRSGLPKRNCS